MLLCLQGWLVDLLNRFGKNGGFDTLRNRFVVAPGEGRPLSFPLISALVKPFGQCHEVLTVETIKTYALPIVVCVRSLFNLVSI